MRYRIKHITQYDYSADVSHCYNLAHLLPRNTPRQQCINSRIDASPKATTANRKLDYFGNSAYHFEIQRPHNQLQIIASSEVETRNQVIGSDLDMRMGISCLQAKEKMYNTLDSETLMAREYTLPSAYAAPNQELATFAKECFIPEQSLLSGVMALTQKIYTEFEYSPATTTIATPLAEVLATKRGVCQDFAHLQIAMLRSLGFAARYVSGYIETLPPPGEEKLVGTDASHAWLAVYIPGDGWVEFDPTNNCLAHEQHIVTAWGRDYLDVTPLKGVIFGGGEKPVLSVSVDVARL